MLGVMLGPVIDFVSGPSSYISAHKSVSVSWRFLELDIYELIMIRAVNSLDILSIIPLKTLQSVYPQRNIAANKESVFISRKM